MRNAALGRLAGYRGRGPLAPACAIPHIVRMTSRSATFFTFAFFGFPTGVRGLAGVRG